MGVPGLNVPAVLIRAVPAIRGHNIAGSKDAIRDIPRHDTTRTNDTPRPDGHARADNCRAAHPHIRL